MANVNISEHTTICVREDAQAVQTPPNAVQNVAIGGSSVQSAAFNAGTWLVRLNTDAIAWVAFGRNPTAIANGAGTIRLSANQTEIYGVNPGDKIAVITGS